MNRILLWLLAIIITGLLFLHLYLWVYISKCFEKYNSNIEIPAKTELQTYSGLASWYNYNLWSRNELLEYSKHNDTCASRDFIKETILIVERVDTKKQVECRVNDYVENYGVIIDLSSHAFQQLASLSKGIIPVRIWVK